MIKVCHQRFMTHALRDQLLFLDIKGKVLLCPTFFFCFKMVQKLFIAFKIYWKVIFRGQPRSSQMGLLSEIIKFAYFVEINSLSNFGSKCLLFSIYSMLKNCRVGPFELNYNTYNINNGMVRLISPWALGLVLLKKVTICSLVNVLHHCRP